MQLRTVFLALPVAAALLACGYSSDHHDGMHPDGVVEPDAGSAPEVAQAAIDTGARLDVQPGTGVGVFVEYSEGGTWRVYTSCDTEISTYSCDWDILVTPTQGVLDYVGPDDLESEDVVGWYDDSLNLIATNAYGFDGMTFTAAPGSAVLVDAQLDGEAAGRYIYWVGDGALHRGAPTNPVELEPSSP